MIEGATSEEILQESRDVLQTNGEWELADIVVDHSTLALDVGSYSEVKYYVSSTLLAATSPSKHRSWSKQKQESSWTSWG